MHRLACVSLQLQLQSCVSIRDQPHVHVHEPGDAWLPALRRCRPARPPRSGVQLPSIRPLRSHLPVRMRPPVTTPHAWRRGRAWNLRVALGRRAVMNERRAVAKELNARSAMANKRQILAGAESSAIPFSPVRASAGLDARPPPEERRGLVRVEHCRGMTCRHHSPQAAQTASTNTLGGTAGAEPLMTPLAEPQSRRGLGHGRCAAKVPQLPQL